MLRERDGHNIRHFRFLHSTPTQTLVNQVFKGIGVVNTTISGNYSAPSVCVAEYASMFSFTHCPPVIIVDFPLFEIP